MNFLDAYDVAGSPTPSSGQQPETSLNEEVSQVVGQLSRFWGGFRKQSQTVIETARKDLEEVVSQAQKELSKLTAEAPAPEPTPTVVDDNAATGPLTEEEKGNDSDITPSASASASITSIPENDSQSASTSSNQQPSEAQPQTLLSRLQASLPPQLVSSIQERLPDSIKHARAGSLSSISLSAPDFAQLRSTLAAELQRVQGTSEGLLQRVQGSGGELLQRVQGGSEELLREASEFLKDAVRVVPPEEGGTVSSPGVAWDGTDVWMIPMYTTTEGAASSRSSMSDKGKGRERRSMDSIHAATRAEALLTQLRHDPQVVRADPAAGGDAAAEAYAAWVEKEVENAGGMDGEVWKMKVEEERAQREELGSLFDHLVPEEMNASTFWTRYFFRVHQVEREEERRKALLRGTIVDEEDFSWEDDDDEATSPTTATKPTRSSISSAVPQVNTNNPDANALSGIPSTGALATPAASTPTTASPRQSSEDSYDVVSSQVSRVGSVSAMEAVNVESKGKVSAGQDEGGKKEEGDADSDWE